MSSVEATFENSARREISRRIVALCKKFVGRGPTTARTHFLEQLVLVVLEDTLTKGERTLAEDDRTALVREMRRAFLGAMGEEMKEIVESETGHSVRTLMADHSVLPDYAINAFILEDGEQPASPPEPDTAEHRLSLTNGEGSGQNDDRQSLISREMVALFKEYVGRGPTVARTYINDELVAVLLGKTLTKAEQTLAEDERPERVRQIRREFQAAMKQRAVEIVEDAIGRECKAFLSDHSIFPDYAIEVFLFDREAEAGAEAATGSPGD